MNENETCRQCSSCRQRIELDATKCHHCTAHQGFIRFLGTPGLLATLALTVVSLALTPPVKDLFDKKQAEIAIAILEGNHHHTTFMISNNGSRPAGLSSIEVQSISKAGEAAHFLKSDWDRKLIEPGKSYIITAENGTAIPEPVSHEVPIRAGTAADWSGKKLQARAQNCADERH